MTYAGTWVGILACLRQCAVLSGLNLAFLSIPISLYNEFLIRTGLLDETRRVLENRQFLQDTWLFSDIVSFPILRNIAGKGSTYSMEAGQ